MRLHHLVPALAVGLPLVCAAQPWGEVSAPSDGPARVIGRYTAGCIGGAAVLPRGGSGYQAMRPSRNRHYGHPDLVRFVEALGRAAAARGLPVVLVGDLGQPRGGPLPSGHRSHQSGLDVDIWLRFAPGGGAPRGEALETLPLTSMIDAAAGRVRADRFGAPQRELLRLAAEQPEVERIFVNPVIKQHLCRSEPNAAWLVKLRPWWGHDEHFHVRLRCPADSPLCEAQKPFEPGDGCDDALARWVQEIRDATRRPKPPVPPPPEPVLPSACYGVLGAPTAARR